jgi:bifunctional non-homologous end joining protein LigD
MGRADGASAPTQMKQGEAANFAFIEPMKALSVTDLPVGDWLYELKFDGYRALAFKAANEVRLISRNRIVFDNNYPQIIDSLRSLTTEQATIDGRSPLLTIKAGLPSSSCNPTGSPKRSHSSIMRSICSS